MRIRVTEALAPDVPAASPHEPFGFADLHRTTLKTLMAEARQGSWLHNRTVRSLLFWLALVALGVLIQVFTSR